MVLLSTLKTTCQIYIHPQVDMSVKTEFNVILWEEFRLKNPHCRIRLLNIILTANRWVRFTLRCWPRTLILIEFVFFFLPETPPASMTPKATARAYAKLMVKKSPFLPPLRTTCATDPFPRSWKYKQKPYKCQRAFVASLFFFVLFFYLFSRRHRRGKEAQKRK